MGAEEPDEESDEKGIVNPSKEIKNDEEGEEWQ